MILYSIIITTRCSGGRPATNRALIGHENHDFLHHILLYITIYIITHNLRAAHTLLCTYYNTRVRDVTHIYVHVESTL